MIITSRKNETAAKSRRLLSEKKIRDREGLFAAEGFKLAEEAVKAGIGIEYAVISLEAQEKFPEAAKLLENICPIYIVTKEVYQSISEQKSPQGIFIAGKILDKSENLDKILSNEKILMLDCVQDSGNLGTMIRTAEALGIQGAVLGEGCADPWSPKALRASMGSIFRLPFLQISLLDIIDRAKEKGFAVYAAMLDETAQKLGTFDFPQKTAVIIGNEGHGVAAKIAAECKKLYIPIKNAESLNAAAAAAVIFWEVGKGQSNDR